MPLTPESEELLPPYTLGERSRELRQRSVLLCWRAQCLRALSMELLHKPCPFGLYLHTSSDASLSPLGEERVMSIGYTWEKLYGAVLALARSGGTLQHRLAMAYREMHMLTSDDFPDDELRAEYARLVQALRPEEAGGVEGTVALSPVVLRPDQARAIAETLLLLYTAITRLEERHYRSLSSHDL